MIYHLLAYCFCLCVFFTVRPFFRIHTHTHTHTYKTHLDWLPCILTRRCIICIYNYMYICTCHKRPCSEFYCQATLMDGITISLCAHTYVHTGATFTCARTHTHTHTYVHKHRTYTCPHACTRTYVDASIYVCSQEMMVTVAKAPCIRAYTLYHK